MIILIFFFLFFLDKIVDSKPLDHPQSSLESNQNKSNSDTDDKRNYQFMLDDEDDEDDMALFNNFALAMSQVCSLSQTSLTFRNSHLLSTNLG